MYNDKHDLWPMLVRGGFGPSQIQRTYHKFGLNLFAATRRPDLASLNSELSNVGSPRLIGIIASTH
jgi:hypothetical protein